MAKLCEMLWPGERITKIRQDIEAERHARQGTPNPEQGGEQVNTL
jgi:hypothetical protein